MISMVLGGLAWLIPLLMITRKKTHLLPHASAVPISVLLSMSFCGLAIWTSYQMQLQFLTINDYAALQDVMPTSVAVAFLLLMITISWNLLVIFFASRHRP